MPPPRHLDLFSGIGGFSLGLESAGFQTIGFSEIDPWASAVLKKHWPNVTNYGDIRTVPAVKCDVLTGGFPCQPFSLAGKRRGSGDDRFLWPAMLDVISRCRPAWVIGENVPGITNLGLDSLLDDLENIGYAAQPIGVPAFSVGAYQLRMRVFIVAHDSRLPEQKSKVVFPTRSIYESGKHSLGLSCHLWRPARQTYLSDMVGIVYGVSEFSHRAKAIGNSIVPQIAETLGRFILQIESEK